MEIGLLSSSCDMNSCQSKVLVVCSLCFIFCRIEAYVSKGLSAAKARRKWELYNGDERFTVQNERHVKDASRQCSIKELECSHAEQCT